jgi:ABC-type methionine transport system ATPase subunit
MDVIAGRKTQGKIEGDILVNGKKVSASRFARLNGYVEQEDIHNATATVRETLLFAAHLRLPEEVPEAAKVKFVDEILELLELSDVANNLIGNAVILGLAPGQLKRVTIGVELVSNPPILFLDEPVCVCVLRCTGLHCLLELSDGLCVCVCLFTDYRFGQSLCVHCDACDPSYRRLRPLGCGDHSPALG